MLSILREAAEFALSQYNKFQSLSMRAQTLPKAGQKRESERPHSGAKVHIEDTPTSPASAGAEFQNCYRRRKNENY